MRWSSDLTIKFIKLYKAHPCLWNRSYAKDSRNIKKRHEACVEIAKSMNIKDFGVPEVKSKIKNLRSTYFQEIKKIKESQTTGGPTYVPKIPWMRDFEEVTNKKGPEDTVKQSEEDEFNQEESASRCSSEFSTILDIANVKPEPPTFALCDDEYNESEDSLKIHKHEIEFISNENIKNQQQKSSQDNVSRKRKNNDTTFNHIIPKRRNIDEEFEKESSYDTFGRSVAQQLKTLSVGNAMLAQSKIQNILSKIGIKNYNEKEACKCFQSDYSDEDL